MVEIWKTIWILVTTLVCESPLNPFIPLTSVPATKTRNLSETQGQNVSLIDVNYGIESYLTI